MIGQTISHYKILAKLGEGGMGVVYKAEDLDLKVTRALKFLPPHTASDEDQLTRLKHEARAAAALEHPNICQVHEIGRDKGQTFIVMSFLEGRTLEDRLTDEGPLPIGEALNIATEVGDALKRAHAAGIVHRDIKPANIMLTENGQAVVMDFGLAKAADFTRMTRTGTTLGTAAYMSPEQANGQQIDSRSDVWSLGVVLYEMLTGRLPFGGDNLAAIAYAIQHKEPEALTRIAPEFSADLEKVIDRALAKDSQQRYQTAIELMDDLEAVRDEQELARNTAMYDRRRKLKRRKRLVYGALAASLVAIASLTWWTRYQAEHRIDALAVLPFVNLSGDEEQEYFSDGLTEGLITELQQLAVNQIRVISRTSSMRYKNSDLSLPEIAAELRVDAVVEASVTRTGDLVKVAAKLIRARPEEQQIWAAIFEQDLRDIAALQAKIARKVAERLQLVLAPADRKSRQVDPRAYEEYLIGSHIMNGTGDVDRALPHFRQAISIDPTYAPAYTSAAHCLIMPTHAWPYDPGPVKEARQLAKKGIELDPGHAFGYYVLGHILYEHEYAFKEAYGVFQRALELNPSHGLGLITYAFFATATGRFEEAADTMIRAIQADPFNALILYAGHAPLISAGRYEEFLAEIERVNKLHPDRIPDGENPHVHALKGEYDRAVEIVEEWGPPENGDKRDFYWHETKGASRLRYLAGLKWCAGEVDEARELARQWFELEDPDSLSQIRTAEVYAILGDLDRAFSCLEMAYENREVAFVRFPDPAFTGLSNLLGEDPRYYQLLKRVGMRE